MEQNIEAINIDIEPTIYVKDKQYTLEEFNQIADYLASDIELNENQQIVFEHLKKLDSQSKGDLFLPFEAIEDLKIEWDLLPGSSYLTTEAPHLKAYGELNRTDQYQVLAAYSEWGLKEVAE
ncbi:MAG: hypothetical protein ACLRPU_20395 [Enterococcus hulanensis]